MSFRPQPPCAAPIDPNNLSKTERSLIQSEIEDILSNEIERLAHILGYHRLPAGVGHTFSKIKVDLGHEIWKNVCRLYQKVRLYSPFDNMGYVVHPLQCRSLDHHERQLPCTAQQFITPALSRYQVEDINRLRVLFDAFGPRWCNTIPRDSELTAEVLWMHRERTDVTTLRAAFERVLDKEVSGQEEAGETILKKE
ncbi:hypothetical protein VNI00_014737 [Paramarasmius palmivorus]|uniref:Uncharacterized protein n=1 Tax=Paramarasmius palmivorus TaxID=297713 RepID=A0AAW0BS23_9AGAR